MSSDPRIATLNDRFRRSFVGGRVMMTIGVSSLPEVQQLQAIKAMQTFSEFDDDNDPHGEHDFGKLEIEGRRFFWKIDYYNRQLTAGSEDPADPNRTTRVLTLMLAEEY